MEKNGHEYAVQHVCPNFMHVIHITLRVYDATCIIVFKTLKNAELKQKCVIIFTSRVYYVHINLGCTNISASQ